MASDLLFLTREGLGNLATVTEYGDFKLSWAGRGEEVWCCHYQIGAGAWTTLRFPGIVSAVAAVHGNTYLGIGHAVHRMNDMNADDNGALMDDVSKYYVNAAAPMMPAYDLLKTMQADHVNSNKKDTIVKQGK